MMKTKAMLSKDVDTYIAGFPAEIILFRKKENLEKEALKSKKKKVDFFSFTILPRRAACQ